MDGNRKGDSMGRMIRWAFAAMVIVGLGVLAWYYSRPNPIKVVVNTVDKGIVERAVANTRAGTVKACRRTKLSPSMGGQISILPIREGDKVKAGTVLLELWNKDLLAELELAQSETQASNARAKAACLQAEVARREANRLTKLMTIGASSEEKTDKAVTQAKALEADCEAAKASALKSESRVGVVQANLDRTRLKAPFDGIIAEINGELNEYVTPSPPGIPTPPAVDLIDISCFYVTAPIDEVDAPEISEGLTARITLDAFGDKVFEGVVHRISPYILDREKQARTVDVEIKFVNKDEINRMLPGYSADVEIILDVHHDVLRVPTQAILDNNRVFKYLPEKNVIQECIIGRGISNWDYTEVISGLTQGDQVVVNVDIAGVADGATAIISDNIL